MCRLYGKFTSYLRRVLCKTRLIFSRINGPTDTGESEIVFSRYDESASKQASNAWPRGVEVRNEKFWAYVACEQALHGERSDGTRKGACLPLSRLLSRTAHS